MIVYGIRERETQEGAGLARRPRVWYIVSMLAYLLGPAVTAVLLMGWLKLT
jgi:hypothetical protein